MDFENMTTYEVISFFENLAIREIPPNRFAEYRNRVPDFAIGLIDVEFNYSQSLMPFSVKAARDYFDKESQRIKKARLRGDT